MHKTTPSVACLLFGLAFQSYAGAVVEPADLLRQFEATALDTDSAVSVRNIELELGPAILAIDRGFLIPARFADGRVIELVFIGQARFRLEPPDAIEAGQLQLFTGDTSVDAAVEEAVLVLARENVATQLLERSHTQRPLPELLERARTLHARWIESTERRTTGVDAAVFKALMGDAEFQDYFAVWCHSFELGRFLFRFDPEEVEQITLGSFRQVQLTDWERERLKHQMRIQRRKGRWLGWRFEDVGAWDIWLSTSWVPGGAKTPGQEGFEAEHYELDVKIRRDRMLLDGVARLTLRCGVEGRRTVRLDLHRDLPVQQVRDANGQELFHFRSGDEVVVLLPQPMQAGEELRLEVEYGGRALTWIDGKNFDLSDSGIWYPHVGTIDRATYDVTLRWPKKYAMFAGGRLVGQGREGRYRWERRALDIPAIAFSFVMGRFDVREFEAGDVKVRVAFRRTSVARTPRAVQAGVAEMLTDALEFFEKTFGPYPLQDLTVVTVPRRYSQSYLGFITLAGSVVSYTKNDSAVSNWYRGATIAHELAHQWWGNLIGWWSYRDQWLSEAMANYSALLYQGQARDADASLLSLMSSGWRDSLSLLTENGRTIESLGPVVLGNRLNSSVARDAYRPIVYRKGAVVLAMLARTVGEKQFHEMLHSLVEAASNRVLTTEAFLAAIERMSGRDLDGFARQYIYGTGIPQIYYDYETDPGESGGWVLRGEARKLTEPRYRHVVVRNGEQWDLRREVITELHAGPTTLMVPFRLTFDTDSSTGEEGPSPAGDHWFGQLFLEGSRHQFEIETDRRPMGLRLDPRGEILAGFYSAELDRKRYLHYLAQDLIVGGDVAAAEAGYRDALEIAAEEPRRRDPLAAVHSAISPHAENLRIRLALARLYLDEGRDREALVELDGLDDDLAAHHEDFLQVERDVLRSRLDIRNGDYGAARQRLKRVLDWAEKGAGDPWIDPTEPVPVASERRAVTEAFALLAIVAHETGRSREAEWATREAAAHGVDVSRLGD